jgi:hypothetical protein
MNTNKHRQQIFWQIYFPLFLFLGILAFFSYSFYGNTILGELDLRIWADLSVLVLTLPLFFSFFIAFIFLFFVIYLISRFRPLISNVFLDLDNIAILISHWTSKFTNYLTHPVIQIESFISQLLPHKKR